MRVLSWRLRSKCRIEIAMLFVLLIPVHSYAQAWSGIIDPARATDWTGAGIPGGLPDASWTQCGSTIGAYTGTADTINSALSSPSCAGQNKYVLLGPGTFNLTSSILFPSAGHVVLRGSGASQTLINAPASGVGVCQLGTSMICIESSDQTYTNQPPPSITGWSLGYAQGSNQITLANTSGINPSNPTVLVLEQCETGYTATSPTAACSGAATDNGQLFVCSDSWVSGTGGCSNNGTGNESTHRGQTEYTVATAVNGNVVTIANPLRYPNWSSGQMPRVWFFQPVVLVGVENLSIDDTANGANDLVQFFNAYQWWVSGCRFSNWGRWAVEAFQATNGIVQNSYWYHSTGKDSYGIRLELGSNNLFQNNIITQTFAPISFDGASSGNVVAYNYIINDNYQSDFMRGSTFEHAVNGYDLYEGNVTNIIDSDGLHGTANMITRFRNFSLGWDSCANGQCGTTTAKDSGTTAIHSASFGRYENNIANVVGEPTYHTAYQGTSPNVDVFTLGQLNFVVNDPLVYITALMWGNYDTATGNIRWCGNSSDTGWSTTCASTSEVPSGISHYPNAVPTKGDTTAGQPAMPASFYLSSKPPWFGSLPWPAIGPDVSGGNVGQCSGTPNTPGQFAWMPALTNAQCTGTSLITGWAGHVNAIPAMNCYLNVMGGPPDATGSELSFDPSLCYNSGQGGGSAPIVAQTCQGSAFSVTSQGCIGFGSVGASDILVVVASTFGQTASVSGCGATWTVDPTINGAAVATGVNPAAGSCTPLCNSTATTSISCYGADVTGSSGIDQRAAMIGEGFFQAGATITGPSVTTTGPNRLVLGLFVDTDGNSATYTAGPTFNLVVTGRFSSLIESNTQSSAGTIAPTCTYNHTTTESAATVALKP